MSKNRRSFTPSFKAQVVLEVVSGARSAAEVCREHQINLQLFSQWKSHLLNNAASLFDGTARRRAEQARIEELERVLGQKTLEAEVLKKSLEHFANTSHQKREVVMKLIANHPVEVVCRAFDFLRSSIYYRGKEPDEGSLQKAISELAAAWPTFGYRRLTAMLKRQNCCVNRKRVLRLMREMGLLRAVKPKKKRTTDSAHSPPHRYSNLVADLAVVRPDQVWAADIIYIRLGQGFVYLAVTLDVYTRAIRGWHWGRSLDLSLTLSALRQALSKSTPEIHHSNQGIQYSAPA